MASRISERGVSLGVARSKRERVRKKLECSWNALLLVASLCICVATY